MTRLPLTLAVGPYDHVRGLAPEGIDLTVLELPIEEVTFRFTRFAEWDLSELSFGKTAGLLSQQGAQIVPIPVFPSRVFRHSSIYVNPARVKKPKDLEGKRVGVPEWAQTAGIYARGMLAHEYGVDLASIEWIQAGVCQPGRTEKVALKLPRGLRLTAAPARSLSEMMEKGDLDAVISARAVPGERLFPDYQRLELEYFRKTRIFPIMHVIALKKQVYEEDRWVAMNLLKAFEEAKRRSLARVAELGVSHVPLPWLADHVRAWREAMGEDFWPYGVEANRPTLEAYLQYAVEQGVCHRRLSAEEIFAPETLERARV